MTAVTLPRERGGWWHAYVCDVHGTELEHGDLYGGAPPARGVPCRYGCRVDTPQVRGAWAALAHQACARAILDLSRGGTAERGHALRLLTEYAGRYATLPSAHEEAQPWMLHGRLFHQALSESIWAVSIGRAALNLADPRPLALLDALVLAAEEARTRLVERGEFRSNYTAWLNAAAVVCSHAAARIRGVSPDDTGLTGEHGVYAHVLAATNDDGWEWEGSTYYHAFVLRAYLISLEGVPDVPEEVAGRLRGMIRVLDDLRTEAGLLPALHDGPYARPGFDEELAELAALTAAYAEPGAASKVTVHHDTGYAILRSPGIHAVVDFGPHGGSHGHRDKLALYLYDPHGAPWQPDPGQVPYGHGALRAHYASGAAHPAFSVNGGEQAECSGVLEYADDASVVVRCDSAYPGVTARRRLTLAGGRLVDVLTVVAAEPSELTAQLRPAVPVTVGRTSGGMTTTTWQGTRTLRGWHFAEPARMHERPGRGPADDPARTVTALDWTASDATEATFCSIYQAESCC